MAITYPLGVGLFIALECYREINQPDCGKLFNEQKNAKQLSCGKVSLNNQNHTFFYTNISRIDNKLKMQ